ncbi:hypothetical protein HMPREF1548_02973 [Clostridium sp. KLE 1755]|nr:hypothetical protein HMPREF1548_02973 [Clostridium sp. KLE 1755]
MEICSTLYNGLFCSRGSRRNNTRSFFVNVMSVYRVVLQMAT